MALEFKVDRSKWYRGRRNHSALLRADGLMCCLGFAAREACQIPENQILWRTTPLTLRFSQRETNAWMPVADRFLAIFPWMGQPKGEFFSISGHPSMNESADLCALINLNDCPGLDSNAREIAISAIFAKHGCTVEFFTPDGQPEYPVIVDEKAG